MATPRTPRRRPEAPSAPTTLTEIARRYYACAIALAKAMGLPMSETFMREHRESISSCFIESGKVGVRLPPAVQLPPLTAPTVETPAEAGELMCSGMPPAPESPANGHTPPPVAVPTDAGLPTRIPTGLQLPCADAWIVDLRPPQLSLLIGKVGLKALADHSLEPLHVALLAERAGRLDRGRKTAGEG